jgi:hypothetical protein
MIDINSNFFSAFVLDAKPADTIANVFQQALKGQQDAVAQMIGGLASAHTPARPPASPAASVATAAATGAAAEAKGKAIALPSR